MSNELMKLSGSNGSVIVGNETYTVPDGKLIFSAWVRVGCQITAFKEIQGLGTESQAEVPKTTSAQDRNLDTDLIVGEYITFLEPLSEITCNTAGGLRVYFMTK